MNHILRAAILNALLLTGTGLAVPVTARAQPATLSYQVPAGDLDTALKQFASQSRIQLIYAAPLVEGKRSAGLTGSYHPQQALTRLLQGQGLGWDRVDDTTYVLREEKRQEGAPKAAPPVVEPTDDTVSAASNTTELAPIVVTGTNIRGQVPIGSQLIIVDRQDIQQGGFTRMEDLLQTIPQNFNGVSQGNSGGGNSINNTNTNLSVAADLRGLGANSTLALIDGQRIGGSGSQGRFVDLSTIPLGALERVEVLPDGASAIYGADAVGGVVNFVLRKDYDGSETRIEMGTASGAERQTYRFSHSFGTHWSTGSVFLNYGYSSQKPLLATARTFAADPDKRLLGGDNFGNMFGLPGTIIVGGVTYAIPDNQDGTSLTPSSFSGLAGTYNTRDLDGLHLIADQSQHSVYSVVNENISERATLSLQGMYSRRELKSGLANRALTLTVPSMNPFYVNPVGGSDPVTVLYDIKNEFGDGFPLRSQLVQVLATIDYDHRGEWQTRLTSSLAKNVDGGRSRNVDVNILNEALGNFPGIDNPGTEYNPLEDGFFNPFGNGRSNSLAVISAIEGVPSTVRTVSKAWSIGLKTDGPVVSLPGGDVKAAVGVQLDNLDYKTKGESSTGNTIFTRDRSVKSIYAEIAVPVIGVSNRLSIIHDLEVSLSGRLDDFSDFGRSFVPKVGFDWAISPDVSFRGAWSKSFRAPDLYSLITDQGNTGVVVLSLPNPQTGDMSLALLAGGGNENLKPEKAETWSAGVEWTPRYIPGVRFSASYYDISYRDRILTGLSGLSLQTVLTPPVPSGVTLNPDSELVRRICDGAIRFSGSVSDAAGCAAAPIDVILDNRFTNAAMFETSGIDIHGSYGFDAFGGQVDLNFNSTLILDLTQRLSPTGPLVVPLNTQGNPIDFKLRGSGGWSNNEWAFVVFANYIDSYRTMLASGTNLRIDSWTTFDIYAERELALSTGWLNGGFKFAAHVKNIFDRDPPFANLLYGYDGVHANPLGRVVTFSISKSW